MTLLPSLSWPSTAYDGKPVKDANNDAILYLENQIASNPHDIRLEQLADLVKELARRYVQTGLLTDIERAVQYAEKAVARVPTTHPKHASWLSNLGNLLAWRYERTGEMHDLQSAIFRAEEALDAIPCNHRDRPGRLSNLGNWLGKRYERTGAIEDLKSAILQCTKAVESTPPRHPCQASRLSSLGNWIARKHERTGNFTDLEEAIRRADEALAITPCRHPDRASYLNNLGSMLARKYTHTGDPADILLAIFSIEEALRLTAADSPVRANCLSNLATVVAWKFQHTECLDDLDYAIHRADEALVAMPTDHPYQALSLISHGDLLYCRYGQQHATDDQKWRDYNDCLSRYQEAWNSSNGPPAVRIRAAQKAAKVLLRLEKWEESNALLHDAVQLLPSISPHNLKQQDRQYILGELAGLATLAASAALGARKGPVHALQLLEQGRGVGAGLRLGMRTDLAALKMQQPEPAEQLKRLHNFLGLPDYFSQPHSLGGVNSMAMQRPRTSQRYYAAAQFDAVVNEIRKLPDFERFLLSPTANELQAAASGGPVVVINISPFRCDALLVRTDSIQSMPLPRLDHGVVRQMVDLLNPSRVSNRPSCTKSEMLEMLEWLWDVVASPILDELGFREPPMEGDTWPHVWWIPTGLLSHLPLHAAGRRKSTLSETVVDRVVSSYSPSVRALLCTQRQIVGHGHVRGEVFLASMKTTPGCSPLPTAEEEIALVEELLPALGAGKTCKLYNPRKADVIDGLRSCNIFHFAGHGVSDPLDPSRSRLLLDDWQNDPLTVESIMDSNLDENAPFLAYLSACSTGANPAERLLDESINLMTAFQLAGFRHTVGSMWNLFDKYPTVAATQFYKALGDSRAIDDAAVAWAVHSAARHIREITRGPEDTACGGDPFAWATYIHIGPYVVCNPR